jgi:hypothetical protein
MIIPIIEYGIPGSSWGHMNRRPPSSTPLSPYTLRLTADIGRQLRRCRASIRQAIGVRLQEIVTAAPGRRSPPPRVPTGGPKLRFYVFDGYRVSYEIRPASRTVAVLEIRSEPG